MALQYLSDTEGNHTAVMIPISEWELLTKQFEGLKKIETTPSETSRKKPSDFAGTMPLDVAELFHLSVKESRENW